MSLSSGLRAESAQTSGRYLQQSLTTTISLKGVKTMQNVLAFYNHDFLDTYGVMLDRSK